MSFFKPIAYKEYIPAQLHEGEEWYIFFYVENPATGKLKRVKIKFNRVKSVRERRRAALMLVAALNERLSLGWNPLVEKIAPRASVKFKDAVNNFIKVKEKEVEANTLRSYNTFAKKLLVGLKVGDSGRIPPSQHSRKHLPLILWKIWKGITISWRSHTTIISVSIPRFFTGWFRKAIFPTTLLRT